MNTEITTDDLPAGYFLCNGDMLTTLGVRSIYVREIKGSGWSLSLKYEVVVDYEESEQVSETYASALTAEHVRDMAIRSFIKAKIAVEKEDPTKND